jgi:Endonuclease/Exonuclease/phosphatase family
MIVIRTVVRPVVIGVGVLVVGIALLGRVPSSAWLIELCSALRVHVALATFGLLALCLLVRSKLLAVGLAVALLLTGPALVNTFAWSTTEARGGQPLRVGHIQLQRSPLDLGEVLAEIDARDVDVFVALAPSSESIAGLATSRGPFAIATLDVGEPIVVITDRERVELVGELRARTGASVSFTLMPIAGGRVDVLAMHAPSPTSPGRTDLRNDMMTAAGEWANEVEGAHIVLGDFNATPMSHAFRTLRADADLADSASGRGWQPTWPRAAGWLGIPIDHLLHSGDLQTTKRQLGPSFGSAHRSLWVALEFS